MFLIHEQKLTEAHKAMFQECVLRIASLKISQCPLVTDGEKAIMKAIHDELPMVSHVLCWNHIY